MTDVKKPKGVPGRPKGSKTKAAAVLDEYIRNRLLHKSEVTPLEVMTEIMRRSYHAHNYDLALEAASRAAPYWHKKLPAAVELSGQDGNELLIQVVKFGDPEIAPVIDAEVDTDDAQALTYTRAEIQQAAGVLQDVTGDRITVGGDAE